MNANSSYSPYPFIEKLEVTRWAEVALWLVTCCLGVPGNLVILGVCWVKTVRTTTHVFIAALATADLMVCLLRFVDAIIMASVSHFLEYNAQSVVYFIGTGLLYTTALLTTAIAFDRFDAVCRSLHRKITLRRAKITAGTCFAAGLIGVLPEVAHKIHVDTHDEKVNTFIRSVFKFIPISLYILSLLTVTVIYCTIFIFIRKRRVTLAPVVIARRQSVRVISGERQHGYGASSVGEKVRGETGSTKQTKLNSKAECIAEGVAELTCPSEILHAPAVSSEWINPASEEEHLAGVRKLAPEHPRDPCVSEARACPPGGSRQPSAATCNRPGTPDAQISLPVSGSWECQVALPETEPSRRGSGPHALVVPPPPAARQRQAAAQSRMTKMLFVATFVFFIFWLPNICVKSYALGGLFVDFLKSSHHANLVSALLALRDIVYLNSVLNVFIYGMANKRFRDDCRTVLRKLRQRFG